jgi:hypothetical protein
MGDPSALFHDMNGSPLKAGGRGAAEAVSTRAQEERKGFRDLAFRVLFLILAFVTRLGILGLKPLQSVNCFLPEVMLRYKVWEHLHRVLGTKSAIALADYFRETTPSLAPCNPFLKDAVVSSIEETQFIARWPDWTPSTDKKCVQETHEIKGITLEKPPACSHSFHIGSGEIRVDASPEYENNFKFESRARGILLEKFVTVTDWNRIAKIISILRYWEKSPDLGVIENLYVVHGDGIYCHCLSLQSIVESVCKSSEQFSLYKLSESRRFYVGSVPQQNQNKDKIPRSFQTLSSLIVVVWNPCSTFLLTVFKDTHIVATLGLCICLPLAAFVLVKNSISEFRLKLFLHSVLAHLIPDAWRDRFYRWLKRKGCFLAFCDDFNPVLHHASDERELITLHNCTPVTSFTVRIPRLDWNHIHVNARESFQWEWNDTRFVFRQEAPTPKVSTTVRSLLRQGGELTFELHQGQRRYFELPLHARTVRAISECHPNQDGEAMLHTQLQLDNDPVIILHWNEPSYLLFVYLMVKWKWRRFGVIQSCGKVGSTNYYHVFSTYELARHIENNREVVSYYILIDAPKPTDMVAGYIHRKDVSFVFYFASSALDFIIPANSKNTYYISCLPQNSYVAGIHTGRLGCYLLR